MNVSENLCKINSQKEPFNLDRLITIPYYHGLSEKIRDILSLHDIKVAFKKGKTIKNLLNPNIKEPSQRANVVYNINCNDCDAVYVGQTGRKLVDRVKEHRYAIDKDYMKSNVADHVNSTKHNVNFDSANITYSDNKKSARLFMESWDITSSKINNRTLMNDKQTSSTSIPPIYLTLMKNT